MKRKKKKWVLWRHKFFKWLLRGVLTLLCRVRYRVALPRFPEQKGRQFLILMNHQTPFDQFFVTATFKAPVYFVATEDIFSLGFLSRALKFLVAPIPIKKQTSDMAAVMNCLRVAREGGTVAMAPEGNRTYTGRTEYMNPAVAPLARKLGLPIALYRIEGGWGVQPRWANTRRKGRMRAYVSDVIEPEEIKTLSDEALALRIQKGLYVDDTEEKGTFRHKRPVEYLERAIYVCPFCGLSHFYSEGALFRCEKCGRTVRYTERLTFEGVGYEHPFATVAAWYDYQNEFIRTQDLSAFGDTPIYTDSVSLSEVIVYEKKLPLDKRATAALYFDRVCVTLSTGEVLTLPFADVSAISALGRKKINIYIEKKVYQMAGDDRFCGLKYVNFYYKHKNVLKGDENGSFLGL